MVRVRVSRCTTTGPATQAGRGGQGQAGWLGTVVRVRVSRCTTTGPATQAGRGGRGRQGG